MRALTGPAKPAIPPRMGRPPLKADERTHKMLLRLPQSLRDRIAAQVDERQVAAFIREAIEEALARREAGSD